ncbi:hypothetical protein R1sor_002113 [Riccia sorocarpa]|uniref:Uncharacterized protein n=1 Tax=Riccia sorocarpa TaxID=122646 RepID=A0ABD3GZV2_9MARC
MAGIRADDDNDDGGDLLFKMWDDGDYKVWIDGRRDDGTGRVWSFDVGGNSTIMFRLEYTEMTVETADIDPRITEKESMKKTFGRYMFVFDLVCGDKRSILCETKIQEELCLQHGLSMKSTVSSCNNSRLCFMSIDMI